MQIACYSTTENEKNVTAEPPRMTVDISNADSNKGFKERACTAPVAWTTAGRVYKQLTLLETTCKNGEVGQYKRLLISSSFGSGS